MTEAQLLELLGPVKADTLRLRKGPVSHSKHGPRKVVAAASFSGLDSSSLTTVQIIDFGCAFLSNSPPSTLGCPVEFFPPELLFGFPASTKSDIWQLAAILYYTYTSHYMFQVGFQIFILLVAFVVQHHGPLPGHWKGKFVWSKYGQAQPGNPVVPLPEPDWWFDDKQPTKSFEDRIVKRAPYLSASQRDELQRLLRDMVPWEPSRRISAAEAHQRLKSPVLSSIQ
jgi:serine/threonine protein kinase